MFARASPLQYIPVFLQRRKLDSSKLTFVQELESNSSPSDAKAYSLATDVFQSQGFGLVKVESDKCWFVAIIFFLAQISVKFA